MRQKGRWDNMSVPEEMDDVVRQAVNMGYREIKVYKRKKWLHMAVAVGGMAAAVMLFIGAGFINPMIANAYTGLPVVGKIFSYLYDLEEYDVPYEQIAESAEPIVTLPKEEDAEKEILGSAFAPAEESGVRMELQEAYCDGYSLYLSMQIVSDTPFMEEWKEPVEGMIQIFSSESIMVSDGEAVEIGNGSLNLRGVFMDANTFVGVARSGETLEAFSLPEEVPYTLASEHMKVYAGEEAADIRGQWEYQGVFSCTEQALEVQTVETPLLDGYELQEMRLQPYEIQAVVEEPLDGSLALQGLCLEAFDESGNRLSLASSSAARFVQSEDSKLEIWMFERPQNAEHVTIYVLDEIKWLDEWKGYLYSENPWTGEEMMEFLNSHCLAAVEVEIE